MNYEPNTTHWKRGDFVIHDADAKRREMLMVVCGYGHDGLCKTMYTHSRNGRRVYRNEIRYLHDPARFGIETGEEVTNG